MHSFFKGPNRIPQRKHVWVHVALLMVGVILALTTTAPAPAAGLLMQAPAAQQATAPLCRFSVNDNTANLAQFDVARLRIGWYINYRAQMTPQRPNGVEFIQMIRLHQTGPTSYTTSLSAAAIQGIATANPGAWWLIGNEPDRVEYQDDIEPQVYAIAYHDLYGLIKAADPTATFQGRSSKRLHCVCNIWTLYSRNIGCAIARRCPSMRGAFMPSS